MVTLSPHDECYRAGSVHRDRQGLEDGPGGCSCAGAQWGVASPVPADNLYDSGRLVAPGTKTAGRVTVAIAAENFGFSTETVTVPAGAEVRIEFDNRDDGVPHNVAVYTDATASEAIFVGEIVTGPTRVAYTFTAPETPGNYFFRCDVHPSMHGAFIVA